VCGLRGERGAPGGGPAIPPARNMPYLGPRSLVRDFPDARMPLRKRAWCWKMCRCLRARSMIELHATIRRRGTDGDCEHDGLLCAPEESARRCGGCRDNHCQKCRRGCWPRWMWRCQDSLVSPGVAIMQVASMANARGEPDDGGAEGLGPARLSSLSGDAGGSENGSRLRTWMGAMRHESARALTRVCPRLPELTDLAKRRTNEPVGVGPLHVTICKAAEQFPRWRKRQHCVEYVTGLIT